MSAQLVCLVGAESSGKTTLACQLAAHFHSPWVAEYLREFCALQGRTPQREEQALILHTQCQAQTRALACAGSSAFVFCDTAALLTAVYSDYVFADTSLYARAAAWHTRFALTLLLEPDLPWVADGLQRDGAHVRAGVTRKLKEQLERHELSYQCIRGQGSARIDAALAALARLVS